MCDVQKGTNTSKKRCRSRSRSGCSRRDICKVENIERVEVCYPTDPSGESHRQPYSAFMIKCLISRTRDVPIEVIENFATKLTTDGGESRIENETMFDVAVSAARRSVDISHYFIYMLNVTEMVLFIKYDEGEFRCDPTTVGRQVMEHFEEHLDVIAATSVRVTAVHHFFGYAVQNRVDLVQAYLDRRILEASTPMAVRIKQRKGATTPPWRVVLDTSDLLDARGEGKDDMFPVEIPMLDAVRFIQKHQNFHAETSISFTERVTTSKDALDDDVVSSAIAVIRLHPDKSAKEKVQSMAREYQRSKSAKVRKWLEYVAVLPLSKHARVLCEAETSDGYRHDENGTTEDISAAPLSRAATALVRARSDMDAVINGMQCAKNALIETVATLVVHPSAPSRALLLEGPPGCGKTTFATQAVGAALKRPVRVINVGGAKDSSLLSGHNYAYEGSRPGRILEEISSAGVCDAVLVFDEVDKIGDHPLGHEIASVLMSVVDPVQNNTFTDNYLSGISLDLSRVFVVFTCNRLDRVDRVLLDRVRVATVCPPTEEEKYVTTRDYIVPRVVKDMGFVDLNSNSIFPSDADETRRIVKKIVASACNEVKDETECVGMRYVEKLVERVVMNANIRRITDQKKRGASPWIVYADVERTLEVMAGERLDIERANNDVTKRERGLLQSMYT